MLEHLAEIDLSWYPLSPMVQDRFVFNGINAATGTYLHPHLTPEQVVRLASGTPPDAAQTEAANHHRAWQDYDPLDADPKDLAQSGWGVVFAHDEDPAILEALQPLLHHRRAQAGERYRQFTGTDGYQPSERKTQFLERHDAPTSGPCEPHRMPYYLLLVGSPQAIPLEFQAHMSVQYATGRLAFDTPEEYDRYARSVVTSERGLVPVARRLGLFGVRNPDDPATALSADGLITGLADYLRQKTPDWSLDVLLAEQATKSALTERLGGPQTPAVLVTASHGLGFDHGDARQHAEQGALMCQDWPGPTLGVISRDMYFTAEDLCDSARLAGLIAFFFACYGAGTPKLDAYGGVGARQIAEKTFFSRLPLRMLGHPHGGALATVAHIDRAWDCSFTAPGGRPQIGMFKRFFRQLLGGRPVGSALECFGARHGELAIELFDALQGLEQGDPTVSQTAIAQSWTANADARNYVILGDPAVRVPPVQEAETSRPSLGTLDLGPTPAPATDGSEFPEDHEPLGSPDSASQSDQSVGEIFDQLARQLPPLEVRTYATTPGELQIGTEPIEGAELRAYTRLLPDGTTTSCLSERDGPLDEATINHHLALVERAQRARMDLLTLVLDRMNSPTTPDP